MRQMNVKPVPTLDPRINEIRTLTAQIVNKEILPNERKLWVARGDGASEEQRREARELRESIREKVKKAGLWAPHLPPEYGGSGLNFLEHAYMNEVLAYSMGAAALFGVVAPNSGNQKILLKYGTEEQKRKWLVPLTEGKMESGFSMTEPESAGSDPRSIKTTARREGDQWVINGRKWFTSNGFRADFFIVMCRTEGAGRDNGRMTQIIVPKDTPGLKIVRGIEVWGRHSDHCEISYDDVRVPLDNALGRAGSGHEAAQERLGAGRVHHLAHAGDVERGDERHVEDRRRQHLRGVRDELHPLRRADLVGRLRASGVPEERRDLLLATARALVVRPDREPRAGAPRLTVDDARVEHVAGDLDHRAERALGPHDRGHVVHRHAVLEPDDEAPLGDERPDQLARPARVVRLHAEEDDVVALAQLGDLAEVVDAQLRHLDAVRRARVAHRQWTPRVRRTG
mgnify:CR=1 FL=1